MQYFATFKFFVIPTLFYKVQSRLIRFLERKDVSFFCVLAAICIKTLLYLHFFQLEGDKLFQALGAKNFVEGRGITFQHVSARDLVSQVTEPVNRWPVGYSFFLAPFIWMTGNIQTACLIVDFLSICFFFFVLFKFLHRLHFRSALINAIILFTASTFGPALSKPTDLLACGGLLFACLLFLVFVSNRSKSASFGLAVGAAVIIPSAFRFMYVPCAIVIPALLLWLGFRRMDKRIIIGSVYALASSFCLLAALLLLQKSIVGNSTYVIASEQGFYPENLLMLYPFIADAFFDINFTLQLASTLTGVSFLFLFQFLQVINAIIVGVMFIAFLILLIRSHPRSWKSFDFFLILTGVISGTLLLLLGYLSTTNSSAPDYLRSPFRWTFVGDGRYFLFPVVALLIIAAYWLFDKQWLDTRKLRTFQVFILVLFLFQLVHTLYFIGRRLDQLALEAGNVLITRPAESYLLSRINEARKHGYNVVLTGTDETVSNWATLNGQNGILHVQELLTADIRPTKKSIVFVLIEKKMLPFIRDKLAKNMFSVDKELNGLTIFSKTLKPLE